MGHLHRNKIWPNCTATLHTCTSVCTASDANLLGKGQWKPFKYVTCESAEWVVQADLVLSSGLDVNSVQPIWTGGIHHQSSMARAVHDKVDVKVPTLNHLRRQCLPTWWLNHWTLQSQLIHALYHYYAYIRYVGVGDIRSILLYIMMLRKICVMHFYS